VTGYPWNTGDELLAADLNAAIAFGLSASTVIVSPSPPTGALDDTLWWDSSGTGLYIHYNDGNSTQWVVAQNQNTLGDAPLDGQVYGRFNSTWTALTSSEGSLPLSGGTMAGSLNYTATGATTSRAAQDRAAAAYSIKDFGALSDGVTDDAAAINAAIAAIIALPHGGKLIIPAGRTVVGSAIVASIPAGVALTIEGMGQTASSLYFSNATDGLSFMLLNSGAFWGAVHLQSFTVTRGPVAPVIANTGINVYVDPTVNQLYNRNSSFRDLSIGGSSLGVNQWNNSLILSGVSTSTVDNVTIRGTNAQPTDQGDALLTLTGPNRQQFATAYTVSNSSFLGGSVGILINGYIQGAFIQNTVVVGQYDSIRWLGVGPAVNHTTTAATASGAVLQFAPNSLGDVANGSIITGTNIPAGTRVSSFNNAAGTVTIGVNVTGAGVALGAVVGIQPYLVGEDMQVIGGSLQASHRDVYVTWGSFARVVSTTMLRFANGGANWAAVEFNESNNDNVIACNILGTIHSDETGIIFSSGGSQGTTSSTCTGNTIIAVGGYAIWLQGTTSGTVVSGNAIGGSTSPVHIDNAGHNGVLGNFWNGNYQDFTQQGSDPGVINVRFPFNGLTVNGTTVLQGNVSANSGLVIFGTPTGTVSELSILGGGGSFREVQFYTGDKITYNKRWGLFTSQAPESGSNTGSDFAITAYDDNGGFLGYALSILRATMNVLFAAQIGFAVLPANYANDAAAAAGGVPVGRVYRNGSVLQVRVA
jgi:hypothetical protein